MHVKCLVDSRIFSSYILTRPQSSCTSEFEITLQINGDNVKNDTSDKQGYLFAKVEPIATR